MKPKCGSMSTRNGKECFQDGKEYSLKNLMKNIKHKIESGETVHGCWINLGSLVSAEIVGRAGFDWVLIDLEHGAGDVATMYHQLQVLGKTDVSCIIRTDELSRSKAQRILDAGGDGIMFPQIKTREEATFAARMMYYPPTGIRGMAKMVRATDFGTGAGEYMATLDKHLLCVIQIETLEAVKEIDAIAATAGVDVLFVGPNDLSIALEVFGQYDHPRYQQALRDVVSAAAKHKKTAGVLLQDIGEYEMYHALGYRFLACGSDGAFVNRGARDMVKQLAQRRDAR